MAGQELSIQLLALASQVGDGSSQTDLSAAVSTFSSEIR